MRRRRRFDPGRRCGPKKFFGGNVAINTGAGNSTVRIAGASSADTLTVAGDVPATTMAVFGTIPGDFKIAAETLTIGDNAIHVGFLTFI